ncbi:MAG: S-layer homology domain-containing protein [Firmicutes bacterium]|nr:S-layer homology domain-containing protein [Bacillota bacterium]
MKKKLLCVMLALLMLLSMSSVAYAIEGDMAAEVLYDFGLFNGMGTLPDGSPDFALDQTPNRYQAVTMLVRLLGKEAEALNGEWETPFTDVVDWAKPYVGYAYANGLAAGTSATTFGGDAAVTPAQYITFALRSLGYESGVDFQWDKSWELSEKIWMTDDEFNPKSKKFTRGDMAVISFNTLVGHFKGEERSYLLQQVCDKPLPEDAVFTEADFYYFSEGAAPKGDLMGNEWGHGSPMNSRPYNFIINGCLVKEGYTVSTSDETLCDIYMMEDGRFEITALREGWAWVYVTYGDFSGGFRFMAN